MNTEGTLVYRDPSGREQRVQCSGGLDTSRNRTGNARVVGVVNVDPPHVEGLRDLMHQQAAGPRAAAMIRYDGQVRSEDGEDTIMMSDLHLRLQSVTDDGTVRLESDRAEGAPDTNG